MKKILLFACIALIFSCNNQKKEKKEITETKTETKVENSVYGTQNYAVVWKWTTTDKQLITDNAPTISQELNNLWKNGVVENAYYDANSKVDKFEHFPKITFFLRAKSIEKAKNILSVAIAMLPVFLSFPPCHRNVRSISRRSHSRTAS